MSLMTRKEAKEANQNTYFTGLPCRNGHVSYRYTTSGTCKECVGEAVAGTRRVPVGEGNSPERRAQREALSPVRLRAHPLDAPTLLDCAVSLTLARSSALRPPDVVGTRKGMNPAGGTLLYIVNIDAADVQLMRDMQNAMLKARGPNIDHLRAAAFGAAGAQAEAARDNGETEWKFT